MEIQTPDGKKFKVDRFVSYPTKILQDFEDESVLSGITVTEGGSVALSEEFATSGKSAYVQVVGKITGNELADASYVPSFSIKASVLKEINNLSEVGLMNIDLYNISREAYKINIKIYSGTSYVSAGEFTLDIGKNTLTIPVSSLKFSGMKTADRIVFEFENSDDGFVANSYDIYVDNMIGKD